MMRTYVRVMGLRWTVQQGMVDGWDVWIAWVDDVDVGMVSRNTWPVDVNGWRAQYWGDDQDGRSGLRMGRGRSEVGGLWASPDEARRAVEERHARTASG